MQGMGLTIQGDVLQAAVYTARAGKGSQRRIKARTCHAPARRLARTTISLGPDEGILFGLRGHQVCGFTPNLHSASWYGRVHISWSRSWGLESTVLTSMHRDTSHLPSITMVSCCSRCTGALRFSSGWLCMSVPQES